jgi:hypothetical protein
MSLGIIFTPSYFCREAKVTPETTFGVSGVTDVQQKVCPGEDLGSAFGRPPFPPDGIPGGKGRS